MGVFHTYLLHLALIGLVAAANVCEHVECEEEALHLLQTRVDYLRSREQEQNIDEAPQKTKFGRREGSKDGRKEGRTEAPSQVQSLRVPNQNKTSEVHEQIPNSSCTRANILSGSWDPIAEWGRLLDNSTANYSDSLAYYMQQCAIDGLTSMQGENVGSDAHLHFQPQDCAWKPFSVHHFVEWFKGRELRFIGDSLTLHQYLSLTCVLQKAVPGTNCTVVWEEQAEKEFQFKYPALQSVMGLSAVGECTLPDRAGSISIRRVDVMPLSDEIEPVYDALFEGLTSNHDVVVMNYGAHGPAGKLLTDMESLLSVRARKVDQWPMLMWRETTPGHWPGGKYQKGADQSLESCIASDPRVWQSNYDADIKPLADKLEAAGVVVLPMYMPLSARSDEHMPLDHFKEKSQRRKGVDCTHYQVPSSSMRYMHEALFNALSIM